jgi:copper transport protein
MISFPSAFAHPFLEETNPSRSSTSPAGITEIITHYSEAVELDFSVVKVLDASGNQIDNKDVRYYENESSLIVSTPPLEDGVYTITTKVLSKIDGHLVDYAFVIGVGDVELEIPTEAERDITDIIFFPEAASRFPGLVGQTIVLGGVIASLLIWGTQNKTLIKTDY